MSYSLLLFDADGTLFDYDRAQKWALEHASAELNLPYTQTTLELYSNINSQIWQEFEEGLISPARLQTERYRRLFDVLGISADARLMSERYLHYLGEAGFLLPGAFEAVSRLSRTHVLALATNGFERTQKRRLAVSGLESFFSAVIISEEEGAQKPDPRFFEAAFEKLEWTDRDTALMIGDSLTSDMPGAAAAGIDSCWFNPAGLPEPEDMHITFTIAELEELFRIV